MQLTEAPKMSMYYIPFVSDNSGQNPGLTYGEKECNAGGGGFLLDRGSFEAQQDGYHHHRQTKTKTSEHHRAATTNAIDEKRWDKRTEQEHALNAAEDVSRHGYILLISMTLTFHRSGGIDSC